MGDSPAVKGNIDGGELAFGRKIILSRSGSHWVNISGSKNSSLEVSSGNSVDRSLFA